MIHALSLVSTPLPDPSVKDYEAFFEARENNAVYAFLGLTAPPGSKVGVGVPHLNLHFTPCSPSAHSRIF